MMAVRPPLQTVEHAVWCDRQHPETDDGMSYMVSEVALCSHYANTDAILNAVLLEAFAREAAGAGTPLLRYRCHGVAMLRLCVATEVRKIEGQVSALIAAAVAPAERKLRPPA